MQTKIPRVAAVHDLSGIGRCALTVIIPVLSTMKSQVCPVPTAVLSTHTGGFKDMVFEDLTHMLADYLAHWQSLNIDLDCIYSGFMANEKQIDTMRILCNQYKKETNSPLIVIDPVMGDEGELYQTYNEVMQEKMRELIGQADVITPNLTEAYFLLEEPYTARELEMDEIKGLLKRLYDMGPENVIITGVPCKGGKKLNVWYESKTATYYGMPYEEVPMQYPGTGDMFASIIVGSLLQDQSLDVAIARAAQFIKVGVELTYEANTMPREGILLEAILERLNEVPKGYQVVRF